ncbi:hypothetical protein [Caulobacter sp. 17J80-11]|uniref:hypothetical protein n=1 Tax=Caulobacter sp. 17J80-11 TaxID=2763502 RepID=UPI001653680D|nr:hypothetical protein [Caulobacter sp. 17J80-11]MBC6981210.1 hypothetical protein [Caulobacter sp. 17J80-11]
MVDAKRRRRNSGDDSWALAGLAAVAAILLGSDLWLFGPPKPEAFDLEPGLRVAAGPYRRPEGCPTRYWRTQDWIARACLEDGARIGTWGGRRYGLSSPAEGQSHGAAQAWVRADDDAVLVECHRLGGCRVAGVVRGRFSPEPAVSATP